MSRSSDRSAATEETALSQNEKDFYTTLLSDGSSLFVDRKSEFLGYAKHVTSEEEAVEFVNSIRKKHADARHNVYAYVLKEGNTARYSDDREPQGTAGLPILDVIKRIGFTDAVIVVTRYFGGILLGTGGLVRAYTSAAKEAVKDAGVARFMPFSIVEFLVDYSFYQRVDGLLKKCEAIEEEAEFSDKVTVRASVRLERETELIDSFFSASSGKVLGKRVGETLRAGELLEIP